MVNKIPISQLPNSQPIKAASGAITYNGVIGDVTPTAATFTTATIQNAPSAGTDGVNKTYADSLIAPGGQVALLNVAQQFTKQHNFDIATLSVSGNTITWNLDNAQVATVTISSNAFLQTPTNIQAGGKYTLFVTSSSSAQLIFSPDYQFDLGSFPYLQDGKTILEFSSDDGVTMYLTSVNTGYETLTPIEDSLPGTWYAARKGYTGTTSNVTAATDFGSNGITGTKTGTGNIIITALNGVDGFDFGSTNTDRVFSLGTPNISAFMPGGVSTQMAVIKPSTTDNVTRSLFSFDNAFDNFYFAYNPSTNIFECWTFDNTIGGAIITGTVPNLGTSVTILTWVKNAAGNSYLYANSALVGTAVMLDSPDGPASVCEVGSFSSGSPMRGIFGDLIVWGRALSDAEREACELELMSIYGVA